eukprot:scaffold233937_cov28-Tisochrysis_lutea.AAC.1
MWQVQLAEQEETIGHLGQAVGRLKQLGGAMNAELASQNAMLNDLESGRRRTWSKCPASLRVHVSAAGRPWPDHLNIRVFDGPTMQDWMKRLQAWMRSRTK